MISASNCKIPFRKLYIKFLKQKNSEKPKIYYIEDNNNYLTNYEKIILFDGLKKIYENYHYRTFVIIINKVNEKYQNFTNFTLEVINKSFKNNTKKVKDEERYLIFFYSIEDIKFSYIRGNDTKDIISDREVDETIIGMDNILKQKEIFFAVDNLIINILCKYLYFFIPFY